MRRFGRCVLSFLLAAILGLVLLKPQVAKAAEPPALVLSANSVAPYVPVTISLTSVLPVDLPVAWYVNGEIIVGENGEQLLYNFARNGRHRISAVLKSGASTYIDIPVVSNPFVQLRKLVPNPTGSDTDAETIILANSGETDAVLKSWELRSRTSSTKASIEGVVPAHGEIVVTVSNKLRNSGGVYDLFNESGDFVDTVTYPSVGDDATVQREDFIWRVNKDSGTARPESNDLRPVVSSAAVESVQVKGVVVLPRGRTIDITTLESTTVHIVVHSSYVAPRPRLQKGDTIEVSGTWRKSRVGTYLSVRSGDTFRLVSRVIPPAKQNASTRVPRRVASQPTTSLLSPTLVPQGSKEVSIFPPTVSLDAAQSLSLERVRPPSNQWQNLSWGISVAVTFAGLLVLFYPRKSV